MATQRKTRDQKIKSTERRTKITEDQPISTVQTSIATTLTAPTNEYNYVTQDMHKIGWIMLLCLGLLVIATVFISELSPFVWLRGYLHLPTM